MSEAGSAIQPVLSSVLLGLPALAIGSIWPSRSAQVWTAILYGIPGAIIWLIYSRMGYFFFAMSGGADQEIRNSSNLIGFAIFAACVVGGFLLAWFGSRMRFWYENVD